MLVRPVRAGSLQRVCSALVGPDYFCGISEGGMIGIPAQRPWRLKLEVPQCPLSPIPRTPYHLPSTIALYRMISSRETSAKLNCTLFVSPGLGAQKLERKDLRLGHPQLPE